MRDIGWMLNCLGVAAVFGIMVSRDGGDTAAVLGTMMLSVIMVSVIWGFIWRGER